MRKLSVLLTAITSALVSYSVLTRKQPSGVRWISAEGEELTLDEAVAHSALSDKAEGAPKPSPMYSVGETVIVVNPYSHEIAIVDVDLETPLYYEVQAVVYDADEGTFRYELDGENEWYAEDWLDNPPYPHMAKSLVDTENITMARVMSSEMGGDKAGDTTEFTEAERESLSDLLDEQTREFTIDRCLAVLTHGNADERKNAERVLGDLVRRKGTE